MNKAGTLYDTIGTGYNKSRRADPYLLGRILSLLSPVPSGLYLDIGCGTGNYTRALASKGVKLVGIDPSVTMLQESANIPLPDGATEIRWMSGHAEDIPFPENTFSGAIATLTIHHWAQPAKGLSEVARVLAPGGRLIIFTSAPEQMHRYWLMHYFPGMIERSLAKMPSMEMIASFAATAGFEITATEKYFVQDDLQDLFLQSGKNRPEIYFSQEVRSGISSFATQSDPHETEEGLLQLRADLNSGQFENIRDSYASELGDYLFIVLERAGK